MGIAIVFNARYKYSCRVECSYASDGIIPIAVLSMMYVVNVTF